MVDYLIYNENDLTYLVDSGSPFSVNYGSSPLGNTVEKVYPGLLKDLSENLKRPIHGIIGTDQLQQFRWHFDPQNNKLTRISDEFDLSTYQSYNVEKYMSLPMIMAHIDEHNFCLIIDTCSTLSYLKGKFLKGSPESTIEDYHPLLGPYTTHGYPKTITAVNRTVNVLVYDLPQAMEMALGETVDGVLGCSFTTRFEWVMDLRQSIWWIKR